MKKHLSAIFVAVFTIMLVFPVYAADRENFSVTSLTVLKEISGGAFKVASKVMTNSTDWTLSKAEALCNFLSMTGSGSGDSIIVPVAFLRTGDMKIVRNATGNTVGIKKYGGTAVSVQSGYTAIVIYNGTNYERVTADAAH
jgi:hypothetical protein